MQNFMSVYLRSEIRTSWHPIIRRQQHWQYDRFTFYQQRRHVSCSRWLPVRLPRSFLLQQVKEVIGLYCFVVCFDYICRDKKKTTTTTGVGTVHVKRPVSGLLRRKHNVEWVSICQLAAAAAASFTHTFEWMTWTAAWLLRLLTLCSLSLSLSQSQPPSVICFEKMRKERPQWMGRKVTSLNLFVCVCMFLQRNAGVQQSVDVGLHA